MTLARERTAESVAARFAEQVRLYPDRTAIDGTSWRPTFVELDQAANGLAMTLVDRGASRGRPLALLLAHDAPQILAAVAVAKAGAALLALSVADPVVRLATLRAATAADLVLTDAAHLELAQSIGFPRSSIILLDEPSGAGATSAPDVAVTGGDLAALICTSGSTGTPLAVMQPHRNLIDNMERHTLALDLSDADRVGLLAAIGGGQGIATLWSALLNGATLCPFPIATRGLAGLADWIEGLGITYLPLSASVFRHFTATLRDRQIEGVRVVRIGSELAFPHDFRAWREHFPAPSRLATTYSSSETGAITHGFLAHDDDPSGTFLPTGAPARGVELELLDASGDPVATGEIGEIVVRGRHLSPGYWRDPSLTGARFDSDRGQSRAFRTGDLGFLGEDGLLTVIGRHDGVVNVNGSRVALSEVESVLGALAEVTSAVVRASSTARGDTRLTAYVTWRDATQPNLASLRRELAELLPANAVPTAFVSLEAAPLTAHGKVDNEQLAAAASRAVSETEALLIRIWASVLERDEVGLDDDFFELGGDSLTAAEITAALYDELGVDLGLSAVKTAPTIAALGVLVEQAQAARPPAQEPRPHASGPTPASFSQLRIWQHCAGPHGPAGYTVAAAVDVSGPIDVDLLQRSVAHIVRRHEALRTTFELRDGELFQIVAPAQPIAIPLIDMSGSPDPAAAAAARLRLAAREPFDLERGPLLRLALVRLAPDAHQLHRVNQHIISDGISWRVFFEELAAIYPALARGESPPLPADLPIQIRDMANRERRRLDSQAPEHACALDWWRSLAESGLTSPLPFERPQRALGAANGDGMIVWAMPAVAQADLAGLARRLHTTYFVCALAAFAALLAAEGGEGEVLIGTMVTQRQREGGALFGCLAHLMPLVLAFDPCLTFGDWLERVDSVVRDAIDHSELPYEVAAESLAREGVQLPAIRAIFDLRSPRKRVSFEGIQIGATEVSFEHQRFAGFEFVLDRDPGGRVCWAKFDPCLYDPQRVDAFIDAYRELLIAVCAAPAHPLQGLLAASALGAPA